jgi:hypothetical protein
VAAVFITASLSLGGSAAFAQDEMPLRATAADGARAPATVESPLQAAVLREGVRLAQSFAAAPATSAAQPGHWAARHPVVVGLVIGTAGGAVLSQTRTVGGANHEPRVMLIGAAAGAWGGLIASAVQRARAGEPVGRGAKIAIAAGAIGLVVLPVLACYGAGGCGGTS